MIESEPHLLRIEAESLTRIARVHEALRDLGLELCSKCQIWKGPERIVWIGSYEAPTPSFASAFCTTCLPSPLPTGEGSGVGSCANATNAATSLRHAIAHVAQPDGPADSPWTRTTIANAYRDTATGEIWAR